MGMKLKYTVPSTPQQNGIVERTFATLYNMVCAKLRCGNLFFEKQSMRLLKEIPGTIANKLPNVPCTLNPEKGSRL